jgi:hypothetical protein
VAEDGVRFVRAELARFCGELEGLAPAVRLAGLASVRDELDEEMDGQLRAAAWAARGEGWGLRRIAGVLGVSHEQVRRMLTSGG